MKENKRRCVVSIAGTDPSGGAGIQADIKAISATGCYAASIVTALVAQNTQGVQAIQEVAPAFVEQQIASVFDDLPVSAIKIGMLHNKEIIKVIAKALRQINMHHVVLDPVMIAKNGSPLLNSDVISFLKENLFPYISLLTPNLFEAEMLLNTKIHSLIQMENAAESLGKQFKINVLVKGGHSNSQTSSDVLYSINEKRFFWFHANRIHSKNTHGTGCTLSSAIASYLAQDYVLTDAIYAAKEYLTDAIRSACDWQMGKGFGPVDHFYFMEA